MHPQISSVISRCFLRKTPDKWAKTFFYRIEDQLPNSFWYATCRHANHIAPHLYFTSRERAMWRNITCWKYLDWLEPPEPAPISATMPVMVENQITTAKQKFWRSLFALVMDQFDASPSELQRCYPSKNILTMLPVFAVDNVVDRKGSGPRSRWAKEDSGGKWAQGHVQ